MIVNTVDGTAAFAPSASNMTDSLGYSAMDVVFTPNAGFSRIGAIEFNVNDGANTSNTASVDINVGGQCRDYDLGLSPGTVLARSRRSNVWDAGFGFGVPDQK